MNDRVAWALCAVLTVLIAAQAWHRFGGPRFATMPILVPVTPEFEDAARARRGLSASRGVEEALTLASRIEPGKLAAEDRALVRDALPALEAAQARLLALRERRHALNIRLMEAGVEMTSVLTPAQWDKVHMNRDSVRAQADVTTFDRLRAALK
jgi:hypothetical protein